MTSQEVKELLGADLKDLAKVSSDPEVLADIISVSFNKGQLLGKSESNLYHLKMMVAGYNETSLRN